MDRRQKGKKTRKRGEIDKNGFDERMRNSYVYREGEKLKKGVK